MKMFKYGANMHHSLQPTTDFSWFIASTTNCTTRLHIDTAGLATGSFVLNGLKYWIVARPSHSVEDPDANLRYRDYMVGHEATKLRRADRFEAVYLEQRTAL